MADKTVRIGGAGGFLGDSSIGAPQLLAAGVDYLVLDYLAEVTMSFLARAKAQDPKAGYAKDFTDWVWKDNLAQIARTGTKIVTNAGGVNPHACRDRMLELAAAEGVNLKIALVLGDDLSDQLDALVAASYAEMYSNAPFPPRDKIASANAYLGGRPIAEALASGADVVITGRVVDSALVLGILEREFGWQDDHYDLMAAGSLCGHLLECGAQACGGLFTDWQKVPDWAHIGYPIAECSSDGSFIMTKPDGTGGLVSFGTVAEQMLYEVGDPGAYLLPDATCDFTEVQMEEVGPNRVRVSNARGQAPTPTYKVCLTWRDGYRATGVLPIVGMDAARKAQVQADAILERTNEMLRARNWGPWRRTHVEALGAEATYGEHSRALDNREVVSKITVEHDDPKALEVFGRELHSPMTSMMVGNTGWHAGRPQIGPVVKLFSFALDKNQVPVSIDKGDEVQPVSIHQPAIAPKPVTHTRPAPPAESGTLTHVRLIDLAYGRSGDKGDKFNVAIIARKPEYLPWISAALTEDAVFDWFKHEFEGAENPLVERFEVPGIHGLNFLCHEALGGGGVATLRLDMLAKGKAQQLLEMPIPVPEEIASNL